MLNFGTVSVIFSSIFLAVLVQAAPSALTYQGRIVREDGTALEASNVSFIFQITNSSGSCILYQEQVTGVSMVNSKGIFDVPIGTGTVNYPTSGSTSVLSAFDNSASYTCGVCSGYICSAGTSAYTPAVDDTRKLRVQFHDGVGWKLISPDNTIRSVPFAGYALGAMKLGGNDAAAFVMKTGIPTCATGYVLTSASSGVLTCVADTGGASGVVNSILGTAPITATNNGSGVYTIAATVGTAAGTLAAGNDSRIVNAIQTGAAAGGDLSGTLPNPTVSRIAGTPLSFSSLTAGQFLKYSGGNWINAAITQSDVSGLTTALSGYVSQSQMPASCAANQTITFLSPSNNYACTTIAITGAQVSGNIAGNAAGFTGNLAGDVTGPQGTTYVSQLQGKTLSVASPVINQILKYDGVQWAPMALSSSDLPSGTLSGSGTAGYVPYYSAANTLANSVIFQSSGNVGIGTATPAHLVHADTTVSDPSYAPSGLRANIGTTYTASSANGSSGVSASTRPVVPSGVTMSGSAIGVLAAATVNSASNAGTIAKMVGIEADYGVNVAGSTGTITSAMGLYVAPYHRSGAITNSYGVYLDNPINTGATVGSTYGVYQVNSSALNYFAGNVGIGTATPTTKLEVNGTIKATALEGSLTATSSNAGAGSNLAPSYSFSGDTDTGFYNTSSNNTISVTAGGAKIFDFSSLGLVSPTAGGASVGTAAGTAAAPTFSFAGDTDTGWYHPAADTLAASTVGTERVRIDSSGNVGIGTTTPATHLHVVAPSSGETIRSHRYVGANSWANLVRLYQARGTASSPLASVNGDPLASLSFGGYDGSAFVDSAQIVAWSNGAISAGSIPTDLLFLTGSSGGGTEKMRITSGGNVGIGRTAPQEVLDVGGAVTASSGYRFNLYNDGSWRQSTAGYGGVIYVDNSSGAMYFSNTNASVAAAAVASPSTKMTILGSGNVGIGTTSPSAPLTVRSDSNGNDSNPLLIQNAGTGAGTAAGVFIDPNGNGIARAASVRSRQSTAGNYANLEFWVAAAAAPVEAMRITPSGNVGIGTTSPSWPLTVAGGATSARFTTTDFVSGTTGSNVAIYAGAATGNTYGAIQSASAGGTLGATLSLNANGGNVGIGTIAPAANLETVGEIRSTGSTNGFASVDRTDGINKMIIYLDGGYLNFSDYGVGARMVINRSTGNVGIGTSGPSYKLDVAGDIRITGTPYRSGGDIAWQVPSDARLKDVTGPYQHGLNDLIQLDMIRFRYKDNNPIGADTSKEFIGVLAQDVQKVIPEAVTKDPKTGFLSLNTTPIFWALVNAAKDLNKQVAELFNASESHSRRLASVEGENARIKSENAAKDKEISELKARLEKIEKMLSAQKN